MFLGPAQRFFSFCAGLLFSLSLARSQDIKSNIVDYLIFDADPAQVLELSQSNQEFISKLSPQSMNRLFDFVLLNSKRDNTRKWVQQMYMSLMCKDFKTPLKTCELLKSYWNGPLYHLYQFDLSVVQINKARDFVQEAGQSLQHKKSVREKCLEAKMILSEVLTLEGEFGPLLETQKTVFECLGDGAAIDEVNQKLNKLKNIEDVPDKV